MKYFSPKSSNRTGTCFLSTQAFDRPIKFIPFTAYQNIAGAPAISLPLGQSKGDLSVGVQFATDVRDRKMETNH